MKRETFELEMPNCLECEVLRKIKTQGEIRNHCPKTRQIGEIDKKLCFVKKQKET